MTKRVRRMKKWINADRRSDQRRSRGLRGNPRVFRSWLDALMQLRIRDLRFLHARYPHEWDWAQDVTREVSARLGLADAGLEVIGLLPCREMTP